LHVRRTVLRFLRTQPRGLRFLSLVGVCLGLATAVTSGGLAARSGVLVTGAPQVAAIAGGGFAGYELLSDGHVWAWGDDLEGQIGPGGHWQFSSTPVAVPGLRHIVAVTSGENTAYALARNGGVWAWGSNGQDELGNHVWASREIPVRVRLPGGITSIAAGAFTAYALRRDGTLWAWGDDAWGQLGTEGADVTTGTPRRVKRLADVVAVAAGDGNAYALRRNGTVWAWGDGSSGQLGDRCTAPQGSGTGGAVCPEKRVPVKVRTLSDVVAIASGAFTAYALRRDGTVWAWGDDDSDEVGSRTRVPYVPEPVRVGGLAHVVAITAGAYSAYALLRDGTVRSWGRGVEGELGDGSIANRAVPTQVANLAGVVKISGGGESAYALDRQGRLWAWGAGAYGQLGNGYRLSLDEPTRVRTVPGAAPP